MSEHPCFRVLLIEDTKPDARLIEFMLSEARLASFTLETVERLGRGIERLREQSFDLVLLDLTLPDSAGLDTFEHLYRNASHLPIVIMSGVSDEEIAVRAVQLGAQDYLVKGEVNERELPKKLQYAIERFRAGEELRRREEHFRLLAAQLPCVFWTTDRNLRINSSSGADINGGAILHTDMIGKTLSQFFRDEELDPAVMTAHQRALEGKSQSCDVRWKERTYHVHAEPFRSKSGVVDGTIGVALDITDQMQARVSLEVTRRVQHDLLPKSAPVSSVFDIAGRLMQSEQAGGDFFSYMPWSDGSIGVAVCDVGGHGLGPAMQMAQTRAYVRGMAQTSNDVGRILALVNQFLREDASEERLIAIFLAKLIPETRQIVYAAAGHQAYLLRADGTHGLLKPKAIPLNIIEDATFEQHSEELKPDDVVLIVTDGILECVNPDGEQYGLERMLNTVHESRRNSAETIVDRLFADVASYRVSPILQDDMTAVAIKVLPHAV